MSVAQLNLRLDEGLIRRVRVTAASRGCQPRDVVEDALRAFYGSDPVPDSRGDGVVAAQPGEASPGQRVAAVAVAEAQDQQRRVRDGKRAPVEGSKAGRTGSTGKAPVRSRQARSKVVEAVDVDSSRGCPNCGGDLQPLEGSSMLVCGECQTTIEGVST